MAKARKSKSTKNLRDLRDPLDYPETRIERYLKCIKTGDNTDLPSTVNTRIERYLYCIATGDNSTLPDHPETMIELYLDAIATGNVSDLPHDPQDRLQRYLYAAAYVDSSLLPSADYTRIEKYISSILGGTTFVTDQAPYLFRVSGGDENANVKHKELDTLVGATMAWNQLVDVETTEVTIPSGHKYYAIISGTTSIGMSTGTAISVTGGTDILTDLTLMLGPTIADYIYTLESGTPGAGVSWLKSYGFFTKDYYSYDPGSLQSVCVSAHRMTGFNQWDEEWENTIVSVIDGTISPSTTRISSKNFIHVLPNTVYYGKTTTSGASMNVIFYNNNKVFLGYATGTNRTFTTPANCSYIMFSVGSSTIPVRTYNHDICINIHGDGERDGEYEPYDLHTYSLDHSVTRRGIYKLDADNKLYADGDTDDGKGTITRNMDEILAQNINYSSVSDLSSTTLARSTFTTPTASNDDVGDVRMEGYVIVSRNALFDSDKCCCVNNGGTFIIHDEAFVGKTLEERKVIISGKKIVFKSRAPTTETVEPFTNPQQVDRYGTEEYVDFPYFVEDRDVEVPVGHITQYPQ